MKLIEFYKYVNTVEWAIHNVSTIERIDSKKDLFDMAGILASRLSRGYLPVRILSWKF
jgi:hypothetical protein